MDTPVLLSRQEVSRDRYGDPTFEDVREDLPPALFAPGSITEPVEVGRTPVVVLPTLYWPRTWPLIPANARILVRGQIFEVVGDPSDWRFHSTGGLVVQLRAAKEGDEHG